MRSGMAVREKALRCSAECFYLLHTRFVAQIEHSGEVRDAQHMLPARVVPVHQAVVLSVSSKQKRNDRQFC